MAETGLLYLYSSKFILSPFKYECGWKKKVYCENYSAIAFKFDSDELRSLLLLLFYILSKNSLLLKKKNRNCTKLFILFYFVSKTQFELAVSHALNVVIPLEYTQRNIYIYNSASNNRNYIHRY